MPIILNETDDEEEGLPFVSLLENYNKNQNNHKKIKRSIEQSRGEPKPQENITSPTADFNVDDEQLNVPNIDEEGDEPSTKIINLFDQRIRELRAKTKSKNLSLLYNPKKKGSHSENAISTKSTDCGEAPKNQKTWKIFKSRLSLNTDVRKEYTSGIRTPNEKALLARENIGLNNKTPFTTIRSGVAGATNRWNFEKLSLSCSDGGKENFGENISQDYRNRENNSTSIATDKNLDINVTDINKEKLTSLNTNKFYQIPSLSLYQHTSISENISTQSIGGETKHKLDEEYNSFNILEKRRKVDIMSVYDRRFQSDERPIMSNGFITRNPHSDDNSNSIVNHYYQCSPPTMATLCNIGNTCYLNSVVYTLRFAPMFLHNLHHLIDDLINVSHNIGKYRAKSSSLGRNVSGIHIENARSWSSKDLASLENSCDIPKSNQQIATEKLHELYQNLHRNEVNETTEPFHADTFLHAIQDVNAIFEGNQQQDAHEFLMCVLDSIRETCQSLIKAVSECPDVLTNGFISLPEHVENPPMKEQSSQRESSCSAISSFFSLKSKRKDDTKNSKNIRLQSPHKDNTQSPSSDAVDGVNNEKNNLKSGFNTDDEVILKDKERISEKIKKLGLDFFTEDFEGITVSTTKCLSCETVTEQKETMIDIAVPIPGGESSDTGEKSHSFIQKSCITREYFRGENKYRCEQCTGYTEAIRSISYEVLPRLLVIQLSRFSGGMEKINSYLPTPFTLQCFCAKCCDEKEKLHVYKLYSVITHVGATMSVGHYIAYTCSLDWANDYINCPKDRRRQRHIISSRGSVGSTNNSNNTNNGSTEKNIGPLKKKLFGRSKASSSGDMSKTVKSINGLSNKNVTNGVEKANLNTTCQSINCCGIRLKHNLCNSNYNSNLCGRSNSLFSEVDDSPTTHSYNSNNYNNPLNFTIDNRNKIQNSEPIWYMCDDDKIKIMTQREFEELLSPNRKIMITPYLLFYARSDVQ